MSAQLEDGYTRIANELLENLPRFKFNGTQLRIIMVVWRFTYGFKRKDHEMSLSFFVKATGLGKTQLDRELSNLISYNVLIVTEESTYTKSRKLGFNKHFDEWKIENSQKKEEQSAKTLTVIEKVEEQSAKTLTQTVSKNADQERYSFKDNFKENTTSDFEKLSNSYLNLHEKLMASPKDEMYMEQILKDGIPVDFIIETMTDLHLRKEGKGEHINGFSYYMNAIRERFRGKDKPKQGYNRGVVVDWEAMKRKLEEEFERGNKPGA
jgi:phage replication O-like protein O